MSASTMFGVEPEGKPSDGFAGDTLAAGHRIRVPENEARTRGLASYANALRNLTTSTPGTPRHDGLADLVAGHAYRPGAQRVPVARRIDEVDRLSNDLSAPLDGASHD
jgi:hypothetical protein